MDSLKNLLKKHTKNNPVTKHAGAAFVCTSFNNLLKDTDPIAYNDNVRATSFKNHILTIKTLNSVQAGYLQCKKKNFLEEINKKLKKELIKDIKIESYY